MVPTAQPITPGTGLARTPVQDQSSRETTALLQQVLEKVSSLTAKVDALEERFSAKVDALEARFNTFSSTLQEKRGVVLNTIAGAPVPTQDTAAVSHTPASPAPLHHSDMDCSVAPSILPAKRGVVLGPAAGAPVSPQGTTAVSNTPASPAPLQPSAMECSVAPVPQALPAHCSAPGDASQDFLKALLGQVLALGERVEALAQHQGPISAGKCSHHHGM